MIKGLLNRGRDARADTKLPGEEDFAIKAVRLEGREIYAFQKQSGQTTALEVTESGAEILQGLAAGVALSELEEVELRARSGAASLAHSPRASREEAEDFIRNLEHIDGAQKQELLGALTS
ncbi:MAG: hypothetical protein AAGH41_07825 [Pseudomonadota bacterium]